MVNRSKQHAPLPARVPGTGLPERDLRTLGPSDSSDSAADLIGVDNPGADEASDRNGTGADVTVNPEDVRVAGDIEPDRIVTAEEAGLGGGLDQAEEAQLGITDEELEAKIRQRLTGRH